MSNHPTIRDHLVSKSAITNDVETYLDALQLAKDRCFKHFGPELKVTSLFLFMMIVSLVVFRFSFPLLCAITALSMAAMAWRRKREELEHEHADQYRTVFRFSSRLAVALESQVTTNVSFFTHDSLEKLERAAIDAANPASIHYHSRLAIAALRTLKSVGNEKTLNLVSVLLVPQTASEEHRGVLDSLIDCSNGIKGRIYRHSGNAKLLRPSGNSVSKDNDLLRPAANQPIVPRELLLRPTSEATAGPE
jgi:hypothetical protein